ncbi:MAG: ABC transporter ATP-binding protein [Clostridiales bacterium]|nr:ABC transporter ATP-binding protein [Clostridiales bacterium]
MLEIKNLNKKFGKFQALNDMSMTIEEGELFGFVGPNGAGKTTTMRIVAGLLSADSGEVLLDGENLLLDSRKLKGKIGYMPDFFGVYDNLKAIEYMEFFASIYGINGKAARSLSLELMELVNLSGKEDCYVDTLSRGMKQRLCLARSLVHNPDLLILDEPASGLDPRARFEMKEILRNLREMGKTILISSHILPELAEMCSQIAIVERGHLVIQGSVDDITCRLNESQPIIIKILDEREKALKIIKENPLVQSVSYTDEHISVILKGDQTEQAQFLKYLLEQNLSVCDFHQADGNLESIFMEITGKTAQKEGMTQVLKKEEQA